MSGALAGTLRGFTAALAQTLISERAAHQKGLLQGLDPRAKLLGMLSLVVAAALSRQLKVMAALLVLGTALALASRLSLWGLARRVWLMAFLFTAMVATPALFLTPGATLWKLPLGLVVTTTGARSALLLLARAESTVTLSAVLVLTTPWTHLLKALRTLHVPMEVILMLAMTHRYVVLLSETANAMFESRQSRMVGHLRGREQRQLMVNSAGVLLSKTLEMGSQVFLAMQSRGFRGEVRLLDEFRMRGRDWAALAGFFAAAAVAIVAGR
jgi:cobalt ECF transporter T component CbiQ